MNMRPQLPITQTQLLEDKNSPWVELTRLLMEYLKGNDFEVELTRLLIEYLKGNDFEEVQVH